jgi:hypothetical protein
MRPLLLLSLLCGCAVDGRPEVVSASIATDPAWANAGVRIEVRQRAVDAQTLTGVRAALHHGPVFDDPPAAELSVALPAGMNPHLGAGDTRQFLLDDTGTPNARLQPFCGRALTLFVELSDTGAPALSFDEPHKANLTRPRAVTVACP